VTVAEPSLSDSVEILKGIRKYYEDFHGVKISDEMCRMAVTLSERYITDRFLPDKAIDLIDEACSDVNLHNKDIERSAEIKKECADLDKERELLLSGTAGDGDFEKLAELRSRDLQLKDELSQIEAKGSSPRTISRTSSSSGRRSPLQTFAPTSLSVSPVLPDGSRHTSSARTKP
jgi:ATP-dependent Clp protease ATP-binding subunit ClpC